MNANNVTSSLKSDVFKNPVQEQQNIRWVMVAIFVAFLLGFYVFAEHESIFHMPLFWVVISLASLSIAIQLSLRYSVSSEFLKKGAIVGDLGLLTAALILGGSQTSIFFPVYLWVIVGNSVRYGNDYLKFASLLSILGFGAVVIFSEFWQQNIEIGIGLLIGLAVVPVYLSQLLSRLNHALKEAVDANQAKSKFLANISHELRTPLTGIVASADLLEEDGLSASGVNKVTMIRNSAQLQMDLINDLLDFSKAESGNVSESRQVTSLEPILEHVQSVTLPQAEAKSIDYQIDIHPEMKQSAWLFPQAVQQVLINLVGNAIKFTQEGGVKVHTQSLCDKSGNTIWRFDVTDTGIGIREKAMKTIFDPFVQADESVTRKFGGTGLGTAICKKLVEMMGGEIGCDSKPEAGSHFWFEIPVQMAQPEDEMKVGAEQSAHIVNPRAKRVKVTPPLQVLVADDNRTNRDVLEMILVKEGHQVTLANNGLEALEALQDYQNFDLVILDRNMPEIDGIEVMNLFKENAVGSPVRQPMFMLITADATAETRELAVQSGVDSFMTKPVRPNDLYEAIDAMFIIVGAEKISKPEMVVDSALRLAVDNTAEQTPDRTVNKGSEIIIDQQKLQELEALSTGLSGQMIAGFIDDGDRLIQGFTEACEIVDFAQILDIAHAIKGSALQLGAVRLAEYCKSLKLIKRSELDQKAGTVNKEMKYLYAEARNRLLAYSHEALGQQASQRSV